MATDQEVAGIRCTEVLAVLSDYLDGDLDPVTRARVEAHVAGCDGCDRFGGPFAAVVGALRRRLEGPPAGLRERLRRPSA